MAVFKKLAFLPCTVEIGLSLAHLWISLACRANISSTGPAAGVAHHGEPLRTSPGEVFVLEQDVAPLDLYLSTCKQDLKCVLVPRFENSSQILNEETVYLNMCSQEEGLTWIYLT